MAASSQNTTFPFGLSAFGPTIRHGALLATGDVFFVNNREAQANDDATHGRQPQTPFRTLAYAVGQATPRNGCLILVGEGHVESIASPSALTLNCEGARIVGLGVGATRPLLRFVTATTASLLVANPNITLENVVIDFTQVDGIVAGITVDAADFTLRDADVFVASALAQAALGLVTTTNADRLLLERVRFWGTSDSGTTAVVKLIGTPDGVTLRDCDVIGRAASALLYNAIGSVATNVLVERCRFRALANSVAVDLESAVTGAFRDVAIAGTTLTAIYHPASCASFNVRGFDENAPGTDAVALPFVGTGLGSGRSLVDELLGASLNYNRTNFFTVTADFASATWNTVGKHAIATVTGACRVRVLPVCTESLASLGTPAIQLGENTLTNSMILSTSALTILAGLFWTSIAPSAGVMALELLDRLENSGTIGYELFTAALTDGTLEFLVWWEPLNATGAVVAGTGATF
jgi:hypothetical protein